MVGAVVLIATAVILIPEMYSEPKSAADGAAAGMAEQKSAPLEDTAKLKTYTIDLAKPAAKSEPAAAAATKDFPKEDVSRAAPVVATSAPPPEESHATV